MGDRFSSFAILHSPFPHAALGRRTSVVRTGTAFAGTVGDHLDLYGYNDRNELTGATTYQGADLANPGAEIVDRRRGYAYDPIGNRQTATNGTEAAVHYCANNLNQYTATGGAAGCSTASETFTYDDDGNMTKDGLRVLDEYNQPILDTERSFYWDTENRLWLAAPKHPQAGSIGWWYKYDQLGRRVRKYSTLWDPTLNSGQGDWQTVPIWPPVEDYRYVYDGWNLVLELDATSWGGAGVPPVKRRYTWGLDLAGQSGAPSRGALDPSRDREGAGLGLHAAGGIGGLLAVEDHSGGIGVPPVSRLYFYDANGNVGQLVDSTDGTVVAKYEYDPYGNSLLDPTDANESGPYAAANAFRFSTKYVDAETGFPYFGYRYLDPPVGRWTSRDPIEEVGGINLFGYVFNRSLDRYDPLGQSCCCCCAEHMWVSNTMALGPAIPLSLWGHSFHVNAILRWKTKPTGMTGRGRCQFHWYEYTTLLDSGQQQSRGQVTHRWQDWSVLWPDNPQWDPVKEPHPCPGTRWITVKDRPAINQVPANGNKSRDLFIGVQVISAPQCNCAHKSREVMIFQSLSLDEAGLGNQRLLNILKPFPDPPGKPPGPGW